MTGKFLINVLELFVALLAAVMLAITKGPLQPVHILYGVICLQVLLRRRSEELERKLTKVANEIRIARGVPEEEEET